MESCSGGSTTRPGYFCAEFRAVTLPKIEGKRWSDPATRFQSGQGQLLCCNGTDFTGASECVHGYDAKEGGVIQNKTVGLLDIEELATRLGVSARYVRRLVAERRIAFIKVGHLVRFEPDDVDRWIVENRISQLRPGREHS